MSGSAAFDAIYALAALAGLVGGTYWMRLVSVHSAQTERGQQPTWRYLSEAAVATGLALILASATFLLSLI